MGSKEKILIYNRSLFLVSQTFMYQQVLSLADRYDVHLVAKEFENPHGFDVDAFEQLKLEKINGVIDKIAGKLIRVYFDTALNINVQSFRKLRQLLKSGQCKAIHAHFGPQALEMLGIAKKFNVPLVVTFHGYDASQMLRNRSYVKKLPELFDYASAIIIVSGHMMETLNLEKWKEKVHVIPCSVDPDQFNFNGKANYSGTIKILHAGRIVGKKGVPDLIKVFQNLTKKYDNIVLYVAGDGDELSQCQELVTDLKLENKVIFYGRVSHREIQRLMKESDIIVLNSRTDDKGDMEGTPVTILEAMSMGKAVVSTKHAGIPYVIKHEVNGLLAEENSNVELETCLETLIENPKLRESLGKKAVESIHKSFSNNVMQEKILKVFGSLLN